MERQKLTEEYFHLRERKDLINQELKELNEKLELTEQNLVRTMENESLQNFKDERFGLVYLREEVYARIEDPDLAFKWLEDHNMGDVVKKTVHTKTLAAIAKDNLEIPGVVSSFKTKVGIRRGKE